MFAAKTPAKLNSATFRPAHSLPDTTIIPVAKYAHAGDPFCWQFIYEVKGKTANGLYLYSTFLLSWI